MLRAIPACAREIERLADDIRGRLADALVRLEDGHKLSMPLSRPMPLIFPGAHELRFRSRSGLYRVIYLIRRSEEIWLIHAFKKTSQQTPLLNLEVARQRIRSLM